MALLARRADAAAADGKGKTISSPRVLTADGVEAVIEQGTEIPYQTTSLSGTSTQFRKASLSLKVKPQISENGTVRMAIFQEVSSVQASSVNSSTGLITNKRSIESSVLVEDGAIVVLGGLLQDDYGNSQERVPGLGDVPLFGNLFRAESRSRKKTNLMVFLRPVVVRDGAATEGLSLNRYEQMRSTQIEAQPGTSTGLPTMGAPVLPEATRKP